MGRSISLRQTNTFTEETSLSRVRDDRKLATKAKTTDDLKNIVSSRWDRVDGAVGQEIRKNRLAEYDSSGQLRVNKEKVKKEAEQIKKETLSARFMPQSELDRELDDISNEYGVSRKQARNIRAREQQTRAQAVLASARAGNVELDRNTKGTLNTYARGDYEQAIYGKQDEATGQRTYARGRYFNELGFADAERKRARGGGGGASTEAARWAKRQDFLKNVVNRGS